MISKNHWSLILFILVLIGWMGCMDKLPEPSPCDNLNITYNDHVLNILDQNCSLSGCHDGQSMGLITPFSALNPARMEDIILRVNNGNMPPSGNISSADVDTLNCWKENGFLEN